MTTEISPEMRMALALKSLQGSHDKVTFHFRNAERHFRAALEAVKECKAAAKRAKELDT